jgi:hypothetical protein
MQLSPESVSTETHLHRGGGVVTYLLAGSLYFRKYKMQNTTDVILLYIKIEEFFLIYQEERWYQVTRDFNIVSKI